MANTDVKLILGRLAEIKYEASELAKDASDEAPWVSATDSANLAEEAAFLGLELGQLLTAKEK